MSDEEAKSESPSRKVKCPQCGLLTIYSTDNKFRPFCSERCKLLDLGAWAEEKYAVPVQDPLYDELALDEEVSSDTTNDVSSDNDENNKDLA